MLVASAIGCRTLAAPPLNETERLVNEILTLPLSAGHTAAEIEAVVAAVREYFAA
jgi:dTDP-4-amino-4,6-dideoxygalactose transaminase